MVGVACFVISLFLTLGLEGLGWDYSQRFPFLDQVVPLCRHSKGFEWGIICCGIWHSTGAEVEFRETESGLVTKTRSLDSLFTSLERLATTPSSVLSWAAWQT